MQGQIHTPFPWNDDEDGRSKTSAQLKHWIGKVKQGVEHKRSNYGFLDWLSMFLPCLQWIRTYDVKTMLSGDVAAGVSVAFMVIPQAVSYANLAGLPAQFGLYGALVPVIVYALVGSSRQLAVGPVAITSLLLSAGLGRVQEGIEEVDDPNRVSDDPRLQQIQEEYNTLAIQVAFIVAVLYTSIGLLRMGFLTKFLPHSVISGFTTGAALTIGLSQLKYITGIEIDKKSKIVYEMIRDYFKNIRQFDWREFVMGFTLLVLLLSMKDASRKVQRLRFMRPLGPLSACVIAVLVVVIGRMGEGQSNAGKLAVVGDIPSGPPDFTAGKWFPMPEFVKLLPLSIQIMLVAFLESQSIATALALKNGYEIDTNREIVGMGLANLFGAMFNAYPTTGSFSRSAVNNDVGAKSSLAGLITGVLVFLTLMFITPVFRLVPKNVLGAIVISSVIGLLDYPEAIFLFKVSKKDWLVWMASFLGTIFIGVEIGLGISVGLALLIVVAESAFPHTAELGRLPGTEVYRNVKQYQDAQFADGMVLVRLDAPIYFANVQVLKQVVTKYLTRAQGRSETTGGHPIRWCCLDVSPVSHIDAAGMHGLEELLDLLRRRECTLVVCNPNAKVANALQRSGLDSKIGRANFFVKIHDAVRYVQLLRLQEEGMSPNAAKALAQIPGGFSTVQEEAERRQMLQRPSISDEGHQLSVNMVQLRVPATMGPKYNKIRVDDVDDDDVAVDVGDEQHVVDIQAGDPGVGPESNASREESSGTGSEESPPGGIGASLSPRGKGKRA